MVASTPDKDVVGESLDIAGADITPLLESRGYLNSDHKNDFTHTVGKVLDAKKIMKAEDATTPNQLKYWNEIKKPFLWAKGELFDGVNHREADAIASVYKHYMNKNENPPIKISVEGKTLERDGHKLKRTLIKGLAMTLQPANRATRSEVVEITKSIGADLDLVKGEDYQVKPFVEISDSPLEKINNLINVAKSLLLRPNPAQTEISLESPKLLEQVKASLKKFK